MQINKELMMRETLETKRDRKLQKKKENWKKEIEKGWGREEEERKARDRLKREKAIARENEWEKNMRKAENHSL